MALLIGFVLLALGRRRLAAALGGALLLAALAALVPEVAP